MPYPEAPADNLGIVLGKITDIDPITGQPATFVWQRTTPENANAATERFPNLQYRREPGGLKGMTAGQVAARNAMGQAIQDWRNLTPTERQSWNEMGAQYSPRRTGYNLYISKRIREIVAQT